jgi:hypothetical protein
VYKKFLGISVDIFSGFSCERFLGISEDSWERFLEISADFPQNCYLGPNITWQNLIFHFIRKCPRITLYKRIS